MIPRVGKAGFDGLDDVVTEWLRGLLWRAVRIARAVLIVGVALLAIYLVLAALRPARAHEGYEWIMNEPRYVDRAGIHCCSTDCFPADAARFREDGDGIAFDGDKLLFDEPGLYITRDPVDAARWWVCRRLGKVKCIWKPGSGV